MEGSNAIPRITLLPEVTGVTTDLPVTALGSGDGERSAFTELPKIGIKKAIATHFWVVIVKFEVAHDHFFFILMFGEPCVGFCRAP